MINIDEGLKQKEMCNLLMDLTEIKFSNISGTNKDFNISFKVDFYNDDLEYSISKRWDEQLEVGIFCMEEFSRTEPDGLVNILWEKKPTFVLMKDDTVKVTAKFTVEFSLEDHPLGDIIAW